MQTTAETIAALLPGPWVFRLGEGLGELAWRFMNERRRIVFRNLRIAFHGEHDLGTLEAMVRQSFRRTGANLLSALHTARLSADRIEAFVSIENPKLLEEVLENSPGVVLLPCHMGNWEILTRIHRLFPPGHANGALYRPLNNPLLDNRVLAQREREGTRLFSKRDSFHQIAGFVRDGGILGILADQRAGTQGEVMRFFGRLTRASPLPSLVARRSKSAVLGMSLTTISPGKWKIRYHPLSGPPTTVHCMAAIENAMKASPLDVFWFQDRWKISFRRGRTITDWLGLDPPGTGKRHRAVVWLVGQPEDTEIPEAWRHPDVDYEVVISPGQKISSALKSSVTHHFLTDIRNRGGIAKFLSTVDLTHALPVDFILACNPPKALLKAAASTSISLVSIFFAHESHPNPA